jgi:hypothetical protein
VSDLLTSGPLFRSAIEEELEVLYDAYYDELEQYANIQQRYVASGGAHPPPPGPGPFPGSVEVDKNGAFISAPRSTRPSAKSCPPLVDGRKSGEHSPQESGFDDDPEEDGLEDIPPAKFRTGTRAHGDALFNWNSLAVTGVWNF